MQGSQRDSGRVIGAVILIGLGILFLFGQVFGFSVWDVFGGAFGLVGRFFGAFEWPFYILLPGLVLLAIAVLGGRSAAPAAFPGAVIGGTGLILWYQNATGHFKSWSYLWGLYPVFVGLAMIFVGARTGDRAMVDNGRKTVMVGIVLTAVFGIFMELIFSGNMGLLMRFIVPLALIGGGVMLLLRSRRSDLYAEKPKNAPLPDSPYDGKPKNEYGIDPSLERRIRDALEEDDPDVPRTTL